MVSKTGIGIGNGIPFGNIASGRGKPYLSPEVKEALKAVVIAYGKTNNDSDRAIVKNLVDPDNPFIISNAAYNLNSGYGKYEHDFTTWSRSSKITDFDDKSFSFTTNVIWSLLYIKSNIGKDTPSFKVNIKLNSEAIVYYNYITQSGVYTNISIKKEDFETPISYNTLYTGETPVSIGFTIRPLLDDYCSGTITQIPSYQGAFVTDGINDLITSSKTVSEMGVTDEITVVSMIHQIQLNPSSSITNDIRVSSDNTSGSNGRIVVSAENKTGIYGWSRKRDTKVIITKILGDKNDYSLAGENSTNYNNKFSVVGTVDNRYNSSVAWYWTIIANKVLTTDQINQVIAYYNLDRTLKPDILCNIDKQGITNDNHAEFNDKLIDYSGNGRDVQMNNLAWKGGSGVAAKPYETFKDWTSESSSTSIITQIDEFTRIVESTTNGYWVSRIRRDSDLNKVYDAINVYLYQDNNFLVHECKYEVDGIKHSIPINESVGKGYHKLEMYTKDRYTELPENAENIVLSEWYFPKSTKGSIKYSIIPSCKGGILLDGINDFGKVIDMPIYKDYTFIIDREIISIGNTAGIVASKSEDSTDVNKQGAFLFEYLGSPNNVSAWSFYEDNGKVANTDFTRGISYQSKYSYNGIELLAGTALDSDKLWLGILRDKDSRFANVAIYSLMSFPYSMSKFLIERQLKKHKLGTFYPNMVEFRPVIKANANYKITCYQIDSTNTWKLIKVGNYIVIGAKLAFQITFDNDASELKEVVSPQLSDIIVEKRPSNPGYNIYSYITSKSPQKINITIDEYIRYEDIVQPYPVIFQITDRNTNQRYSWGDKIKVGSSIRLSQSEKPNLLSGLYSIKSYEYEGETYSYNQLTNLNIILTKQSISLSCNKTWLLDDNEPKCILNNSAYALASGANGYPYDYNNSSFWRDSNLAKVVSGELIEYFAVKNSTGFSNITSGVYKGEIKVTGVTKAISENKISQLRIYTNSTTDNELIDITQDGNYNIDIKGVGDANRVFFYAIPNNPNESIVVRLTEPIYIEQVGEYEGAYCLDGVDDFVTIPTVTGGKQVLMKVNWQSDVGAVTLYDQRLNISDYEFAIYNGTRDLDDNPVMAYQGRNNGQTYIDGILNSNIMASELKAITHNITITNELSLGINNTYPVIGSTKSNTHFAQMSLYDFMLFDEISTDDKIKELNEYVGIEAKVELPPYYWDAYGKTNLDADKATIQQRGTAVGDYDLTNYNHAYDKMSGYGGYKFAKFDNELDWYLTPDNGYIDVVSRNGYSITLRNLSTSNYGWYFQNSTVKEFITKDIPFKVKANKSIRVYWDMHSYKSNGENFGYVVNNITLNPNEDTSINLRHLTEEELTELDANKDRMYYLLWFDLSTLAVDEEVTIEMLPLYPNGLAYDGITDYSKNANIPVLTDHTYIYKRTIINIPTNAATLLKSADKTNGGAFIADYGNKWQFNFGQYNIIQGIADGINWQTVNSFNGTSINKGENTDDSGITVAKFSNGYTSMVFYKLILYPKTISLLEINFLKNLMEKDEIIDLNNPIFIKNE